MMKDHGARTHPRRLASHAHDLAQGHALGRVRRRRRGGRPAGSGRALQRSASGRGAGGLEHAGHRRAVVRPRGAGQTGVPPDDAHDGDHRERAQSDRASPRRRCPRVHHQAVHRRRDHRQAQPPRPDAAVISVESIAVLVVDDSVVVRRIVTSLLSEDPDIRVAGTAASGRSALEKIEQIRPDVLTLDLEMPEMDGLETLRHLRRLHPRLPVIMFSTLTERAAAATLEAISLGARDYVTKPGNVGSASAAFETVRSQLLPKIKALVPSGPPTPAPAPTARPAPVGAWRERSYPHGILAIGSSTGGPDALETILRELPAELPVPVAIVQHMPPIFTRLFAQRLDRASRLTVVEGRHGLRLEPGLVVVAPGDTHLLVVED